MLVNVAAPLVRAAISSQRALPSKVLPKSRLAVNSPLLTPAAVVVRGPATALPLVIASKRVNRTSYHPLADVPPTLRRPW